MRIRDAWISIAFAAALPGAVAQELVLANPIDVDRPQEVIEISLGQVLEHLHITSTQAGAIIAEDKETGKRIATQLERSATQGTADHLLLLVQLRAHGQERIRFRIDPNASQQRTLVFGRAVPERLDDFAWENEMVAHRIYGPALEATGEISSGIDVWSKRAPNFVVDSFYKRASEGERTNNPGLSYHVDNGQGLDSYDVGPSRGCGGTAAFANGKLVASKNFTGIHILANGPIRFSFEVAYAPWDVKGVGVTETKRITLDAGMHMNRIESTFTFHGTPTLDLAAGIAVHAGAHAEFPEAGNIASVWDMPQDPSAGRIATGLIATSGEHARTLEAANNAVMIFTRHSGEPFVYFAGSGWSKADMPSAADWNNYLRLQLKMLENPIEMRWSR